MDSTMLIDATLKHAMSPLALPAREYMENAQAIWKELGLPPLTIRQPWHGYSLGDWNENWDQFARNAISGQWEKNGANTETRRRSGLTPETPVRNVEGREKPRE
jgi:4-hydroxy-3-polyprenylbenzoate decarboxylase